MNTTGEGSISASDAGLIYIVGYIPSVALANAAAIIYAIVVCCSLYRSFCVRRLGLGSRSCFCCCCCCCLGPICHYTTVLPVAAIIELIGYGCRSGMARQFGAWNYLFSTSSLLIAPVIVAIMNYKVVGLLLAQHDLRVSCFSARALSSISIFIDVTCATLQFGASVCSTLAFALGEPMVKEIADDALICSFVLQLGLNIGFTAVVVWMYREPTFAPRTSQLPHMARFWSVMWSTVSLLWIRNLFRVLEAFAVLAGHTAIGGEALFYILDTLPVLICFIMFNICHYALIVAEKDKLQARGSRVIVVDV